LGAVACGGQSESNDPVATTGGSGGLAGAAGSPARGGGPASGGQGAAAAGGVSAGASNGGSAPGGESAGGSSAEDCDAPSAPTVPLRRLSTFEYDNTIRDLFGVTARPASALFADEFPIPGSSAPVSAAQVTSYHVIAHELASDISRAPEQLMALLACDAVTAKDTCRERLMTELLPVIFRGPLQPQVQAEMEAVFETGEALGGDFESGVRAVIEVALQSPEFLYRVEFGEMAPDVGRGIARPTPHEMAVRLSYFFTGSTPDSALLRAAEQDELKTKEQVAAQARRLLAGQNAREVVRYFYLKYLGVLAADPTSHVSLGSDIVRLMIQETEAFVDDVTFQGKGDLHALLTSPSTWVNGELAQHYGIAGISGDAFEKVELEPRRAGLLTQGLFLTSTSTMGFSNASRRGGWVLRNLLCSTAPPHPVVTAPWAPGDPSLTTRERFERGIGDPACVACHRHFDPIGFGLEHYDAVGLFRETEAGKPIDASGQILVSDAQGRFDGALELATRLASSKDVQSCYADRWLSFAYGRPHLPEDACSRQSLQAAFATANGNVLELLIAISQTDGFLYRPVSEVSP
jgi:hypothetical protein